MPKTTAKATAGKGKKKVGRGRPLHDGAGVKKPKTVWLTPPEIAHLEELGGTVGEALQILVQESIGRKRRKGANRY